MNKNDLLIILFDYYEELLSDSQKKYFVDYYFNNLSLAEISENENVSRNAVSKDLKLTKEKLKLYDKDKKMRNIIKQIKDEKLKNELEKILDE